jgi:hypothetical protein
LQFGIERGTGNGGGIAKRFVCVNDTAGAMNAVPIVHDEA